MRSLISLHDLSKDNLFEIFSIAKEYMENPFSDGLKGKFVILFFPESSIRTRVTFEKAISNMGGDKILFPSDALGKKEKLQDVICYLNNWADLIIARYNDINVLKEIEKYSNNPVINGLSNVNHPCEVITDLFSIREKGYDIFNCKYLYVGVNGNIGMAWKEASDAFGLSFTQCCPKGYEIEGAQVCYNIEEVINKVDVIITDSLPANAIEDFRQYQITEELLNKGKKTLLFAPCPPFYRGEEVSEDAILHSSFVGYSFKKNLLNVQQAIIEFCMGIK